MPTLEITDEERKKYFDFVDTEIKKTRNHDVALGVAELYHYTSGEGLVSIVGSGDLWVTQASCLNDATEVRFAVALLLDAFQKRRGFPLDPEEAFICNRAIAGLAVDPAPTSEWFVACLSQEKDDLSLWRAYGRGEGGYAIGFDVARLVPAVAATGNLLAPVCYDPPTFLDIAVSVVRATEHFFKEGLAARSSDSGEWADVFLPEWRNALAHLTPILKHWKFAAEKEWRIIRGLQEEDLPNLKFRQRQSMLTRHLPIALRFPGTQQSRLLPISSVWVRPSRHKEISRASVADLLRAKGYPKHVFDNVRLSEAPYQAL